METEIWKDIETFEGLYQISNFGRVKSFHKGAENILALKPNKVKGYVQVNLAYHGKVKKFLVHSLVASAFIGTRPHGSQINHINFNKADNRAENLEYLTQQENVNHSIGNYASAERNGRAKLRNSDVLEIRKLQNVQSAYKTAQQYNVDIKAILRIWKGETWKKFQPHAAD